MIELEKLQKAYDILSTIINSCDEKCRYDHHGYCQTHWLHDKPCPIEQAKELFQTNDP